MKKNNDSTDTIVKILKENPPPLQFGSRRGLPFREFNSPEECEIYSAMNRPSILPVVCETPQKASEQPKLSQQDQEDELPLDDQYFVLSSNWQPRKDGLNGKSQKVEDSQGEGEELRTESKPKPWFFGEALETRQERIDEKNKEKIGCVRFPVVSLGEP